MEEACDDIDQMFSNLLGEMDLLTQSLGMETVPPPTRKESNDGFNFAVGFKDLNESLNALEDTDLDALMADLVADISEVEKSTLHLQKDTSNNQQSAMNQPPANAAAAPYEYQSDFPNIPVTYVEDDLPPPPAEATFDLPPPLPPPPSLLTPEPLTQEDQDAQAKADKIKLALEKLKEAKVKKLVVKVHMNDNSTKSLMVDERQVTRDILDNLFEKTHCDCNIDWCLYEIYPELQIERFFEDHENVIGVLSDWTRDTENKILFLEKNEKYAVFKNPQNFYLANVGKHESKEMNEKSKEALLEESFCGTSVIVPEVEGALYLKEDGKKSWKRRYFLLRASGIYYVPKGKTKTSRDLACFIQFENVNVYYGVQYKVKYKAPTDYCFVLKHPQLQKESQYIKYLCCDDRQMLHQWVTGIRIAKYGKTLYDNYICAVQKTGLASRLAKPGNNTVSTVGSSSEGITHANGQVPQIINPTVAVSSVSEKASEIPKVKKPESVMDVRQSRPPPMPQFRQHKPGGLHPPPPPQRRSSAVTTSLNLPTHTERRNTSYTFDTEFPPPPELLPPPPELDELPPPPPPPPECYEAPPDFIPPPPPSYIGDTGSPEMMMPPPPPPSFPAPDMPPLIRKKPPPPPRRQEDSDGQAGRPRQSVLPRGDGVGQGGDFMSDLMKALEKKRSETS
nr:amyloid beta A4 precursor protein-binding family B member 1-interacting protein [Anolis sagrei ordinatus]